MKSPLEDALFIIPARGGSLRLKDKNITPFLGIPLVAFSIAFGQACGFAGRIFVSTNDHKIKQVAKSFGAQIIDRPQALSTATSTTAEAVLHALTTLASSHKYLLIAQPTNPLREKKHLDQAFNLMHQTQADSVFTVTPNYAKTGKLTSDNRFIPTSYFFEQRKQDLQQRYDENGILYLVKVASLLKYQCRFGQKPIALPIDHFYALTDIDTQLDLELTEFIYYKYAHRYDWIQQYFPLQKKIG